MLTVFRTVAKNPAVGAHCVQIVYWLAEDGKTQRTNSVWGTEQILLLGNQQFIVGPSEFGIRQIGIIVLDGDYYSLGTRDVVEELLSPWVAA